MKIIKYIKTIFLFLLTFLVGVQTTYAKTEFVLPQNQVVFSVEQSQSFHSLEKEVQSNIGFLNEKSTFVTVQYNSAVNTNNFSKSFVESLANAGSDFAKLSTKSSLSTSLFNSLDNALASAPSIKFNYGTKTLQSPKQFLNATGNDMYDIVLSNGGYAKFDNVTGRMLYSDGTNQFFVRYADDGVNVSNVESFVNGKVSQLKNCIGLNGSQTVQLPSSLGGSITTSTSKTSTFLGKTTETQVLKDQFGNFKHIEIGETAGSVNLLNMPDPYFNGPTWFLDYNQGWMQRAINRGDDIYVASPIDHGALIKFDGTAGGSYYANELNELIKAGIKPKNLSVADWELAKIEVKKYVID